MYGELILLDFLKDFIYCKLTGIYVFDKLNNDVSIGSINILNPNVINLNRKLSMNFIKINRCLHPILF